MIFRPMIIICPSCETHFDVPEAALNPAGRTVRCAHCGHKWHQDPPEAEDFEAASDFDDAPLPSPPPPPPPPIEEEEEEDPPPPPMSFFINADPETKSVLDSEGLPFSDRRKKDEEIDEEPLDSLFPPPLNDEPQPPPVFDDPPPPASAIVWPEDEPSSASDVSLQKDDDLSWGDESKAAPPAEEIPAMLKTKKTKAPPPPPKKKRSVFRMVALFPLLPLLILATGLFALRDAIIQQAPFMEDFYEFTDAQVRTVYDILGLESGAIGYGLTFREIDSERIMQDDTEVMIVRGIIFNKTDDIQDIPTLRLALLDGKGVVVQEKEMKPPQFLLPGKSSVPFMMTLDNPDMSASRFEITFSSKSTLLD